VVVYDFNIVGIGVFPGEADAPLVIDADAVLPFSITLQSFQMIARRLLQVLQVPCAVEIEQLAPCLALYRFEPDHKNVMEQGLSVFAAERLDHD
jgi:hypothetical protein